jgi:hypothetical protein
MTFGLQKNMLSFSTFRERNIVTFLGLITAAFGLYFSSSNFEFIYYDDIRILAEHPELYNGPTLRDSVSAIFTLLPREEPLLVRDLSWALDSRIFGFYNPHGFHFVNVVLHASIVGLCFLTMLQITRRYAVAVLTAVCFLLLAVHVEPVAWIMGRKDLLVAFWGFLALIFQSQALDAKTRSARYVCYGGVLLALTLALFSKISALVFPGVLFFLALFQPVLRGDEPPRGAFPWRRIPQALVGVLPHLIISLAVFHWYRGVLGEFGVLNRGYTATTLQHIGNLFVLNPLSWLRDLQLILFPWDMGFLHIWPGNLLHFEAFHMILASGVWIGLAVLSFILLTRRRDLAFYLLSFFVLMVPYMNIQYIGIWVANRYLYFSAFCVMAFLATVTMEAWTHGSRPKAWGAAILIAVMCANNAWCLTATLPSWRNAETLWGSELRRPNPTPDEFYGLASFYYTMAMRAADPAEREKLFIKTEALVAQARPLFDKPYVALQNLLLLDALVAIGRNAPDEQRLGALLSAEKVGPYNDAILWQLMLFYYKKALPLSDSAPRDEMARKALAYYSRYRGVINRSVGFAAKDQSIRAEFRADFPGLAADLDNLK